jgi:hypothetical protein
VLRENNFHKMLAAADSVCLFSMNMRPERTIFSFKRVANPALAAFLAFLLLLSGLLAANPALHKRFHSDVAGDTKLCVVCLLAQGQVNSAELAPVLSAFAFALLFLVLPFRAPRYAAIDLRISPSRGPPSTRVLPHS